MKHARLVFAAACLVSLATVAPRSAQDYPNAIVPTAPIKLFNGTSLANFDTWLVDHHATDPLRVFSVVDQIDGAPAIRISGEKWGGIITKQAYRNYKFIAEYRWGDVTWGDRKARTKDSGVLFHGQGRLGNTARDFNGPWVRSIEYQIIEGGVGDIIVVTGFGDDGVVVRPSLKALTRKDRDNETVYDPNGTLTTHTGGRINWWGRSEDWADRLGFRGPKDVETAGNGWTRIEALVDGGKFTYMVNGQVVNAASDSSFTSGKIMIQSEGAEIYFRRLDLEPLR
jgi:hypothetical protein